MAERKTTEIKLRVTPDEKARWQLEAERQGIALSELIRQTLNGLVQNQALLSATSVLLGDGTRDIIHVVLGDPPTAAQSDDPPQEDVPTSDEVDSLGDEQPAAVKPWMFEGRSDA